MIIKKISNKLKKFLTKRVDETSRRTSLSDNQLVNFHSRVLNAYIENDNGKVIYNYQDKKFDDLTDEFGRNLPTLTSISTSTEGYLASLIKTTINFRCNNIEQLTYMFNNFQNIGQEIKVCFGWNNISTPKDFNKSKKINDKMKTIMSKSLNDNILNEVIFQEDSNNVDNEMYFIKGIISNFSQSSAENGKLDVSISLTTAGNSLLKLEKEYIPDYMNIDLAINSLKNSEKYYEIREGNFTFGYDYFKLIDFVNEINKSLKGNSFITIYDLEYKDNDLVVSDAKFPYYSSYIFPYKSLYPMYVLFNTGLYAEKNKGFIKNILISESLIKESFKNNDTLLAMIQSILSKINESTNDLTNIQIDGVNTESYNISNNEIEIGGVDSNFTLSLNNNESIIKSINFSSKVDNVQKAIYVSDILGINKDERKTDAKTIEVDSLKYFFNIDSGSEWFDSLTYSLIGAGLERKYKSLEVIRSNPYMATDPGKAIDYFRSKIVKDNKNLYLEKPQISTSVFPTEAVEADVLYGHQPKIEKKWSYINFINQNLRWDLKENDIDESNKYYYMSINEYLTSVFNIFKKHDDLSEIEIIDNGTKVITPNIEFKTKKMKKYYNLEVSITMDGINGFRYGDIISIDYFNNLFSKEDITPLFMVKKISHTVDNSMWDTTIDFLFIPKVT